MRFNKLIAAMAAVSMLAAVSCEKKKDNYQSSFGSGTAVQEDNSDFDSLLYDPEGGAGNESGGNNGADPSGQAPGSNDYTNNKNYQDPTLPPEIQSAADGPRLYMKDAEASPGEEVLITMAVENADMKWDMCGIHVTYPDFLKCKMRDEKEGFIWYKTGDASEARTGAVGMIWRDGLPQSLVDKHLGCVFFTETFSGTNFGGDGDVVTFSFTVPEDAEPGEYPLGFYYRETDMFIDIDQDLAMQKYVFENWREGTLTIK